MVAALQAPPRCPDRRRVAPSAARVVPASLSFPLRSVVPCDAAPERVVTVHRQPRPRVTRSHGAAVYWRRRLIAAALGLGLVLTATHAGAALGGSTTTSPERSPHVHERRRPVRATRCGRSPAGSPRTSDPRAVVDALVAALRHVRRCSPASRDQVGDVMAGVACCARSLVGSRVGRARGAISWGDVASARSSSGAPRLRARSRRDPRSPCTPTRSEGTRRDRDRVAVRAR